MLIGKYNTLAGSFVYISGKLAEIETVDFDWFEEPEACVDCRDPHVVDKMLSWFCDECGGGCASLYPTSSYKVR